jgi:hypothetical protein
MRAGTRKLRRPFSRQLKITKANKGNEGWDE